MIASANFKVSQTAKFEHAGHALEKKKKKEKDKAKACLESNKEAFKRLLYCISQKPSSICLACQGIS